MVRKSGGFRKGTRNKFKIKKKLTMTDYLREFQDGQKVHLILKSSSKSIPHPRFHGKTGEVVGKRGSAYLVKVRDGKSFKTIVSTPEHMKLVE